MNVARQILEFYKEPVEARIARIESDVGHLKKSVAGIQGEMKAANDAIAELQGGLPQPPRTTNATGRKWCERRSSA